jgi:hypothetical protein
MTLKERVKAYCSYKKITIAQFERASGLSNGYFNQVSGSPSKDKLSNILKEFPDLNRDWLLYEEGEMLNQNAALQTHPQEESISIPRSVWSVIENQAASLKAKDESLKIKDEQMGEVISMLRDEIAKRGHGVDESDHAARQAAGD